MNLRFRPGAGAARLFLALGVIAALTGNDRPRRCWNDLKIKLMREGSELSDKIGQLKLPGT